MFIFHSQSLGRLSFYFVCFYKAIHIYISRTVNHIKQSTRMTHTDRVCAETLQHPALGRRFVARSNLDEVDAFSNEVKAKFSGCTTGNRSKLTVIRSGYVDESRPESII